MKLRPTREGNRPTIAPPHPLDPGFHGVRTRWIRGFMASQLALCTRTMVLAVPM
jgi:hypothetical protein